MLVMDGIFEKEDGKNEHEKSQKQVCIADHALKEQRNHNQSRDYSL